MPILEILQQILMQLLQLFFMLFNPIILIPLIIIAVILVKKNKEYKNSAYYQVTKLPYCSVKRDIGRYGEYLTYKHLKNFETAKAKFLFNIYVPKENGETTEIDVLMICPKGVFVFESKNYSGWIFGSENQKNWYQTLPKGRGKSHKEHFYNPIMQNRSHIKHLTAFLGEQVPMRSIIVFSDRCTLKNVQIKSNDISVTNRYLVSSVVADICNQIPTDLLSENEISDLYDKLYPYTQVDALAKAQHIANIHDNLNSQPIQQSVSTVVQSKQTEHVQVTMSEEPKIENIIQTQVETVEADADILNAATPEIKPASQDNAEAEILKCPKCGGNLVLRTASRGQNAGNKFYGCSNYPKCKYLRTVMSKTELER